MRLLKPTWVSHDGKPIFSVDIHPDGSRFATGGQGDSSGKIVIWNMAPVRDEKVEKNEKHPKMLCQMENHLACVNCVRWSYSGCFLASGGDDNLVMIWQVNKYAGPSTVFGSEGNVINVEQWRCVSTLRAHSGDVLDLSWSVNDEYLATSSIDNTVIIWNAQKFPEQISVLRGHTGMVKGVTWDPIGKYLASQSDDKSIRIWRTLDWQLETTVTKPFEECGGTTHALRLDWSPDGHYCVSAHAMNNCGPTAQIIERSGWNTEMDYVGHRKAVTVVRFNPKILRKKVKKTVEKPEMVNCCAIGSRDQSLSIWITALKRPLVVIHDLFTNSVLDISWSQNGMEMICCSVDGTVAYFEFSQEELGTPLTDSEKSRLLQKVYGQSIGLSKSGVQAGQIIESADLLKLQSKENGDSEKKPDLNTSTMSQLTVNTSLDKPFSNSSQLTPNKTNKQIETKTPDGRRRITPIFLEPQPMIGISPPKAASEPQFSSSKSKSSIIIEKLDEIPSSLNVPTSSTPTQDDDFNLSPIKGMTSKEARAGEKAAKQASSPMLIDKSKIKRKLDAPTTGEVKRARGRPRKIDTAPVAKPAGTEREPVKVQQSALSMPVNQGLNLPVSTIEKAANIPIDDSFSLDIANGISVGHMFLYRVRCTKASVTEWESILSSRINAVTTNNSVCVLACIDCSLHVFATSGGQRLLPPLQMDSKISILKSSGIYVMAVSSKGTLFVWDIKSLKVVIKNESLSRIIHNNDVKIVRSFLTSQGLPVFCLSNGQSMGYSIDLGCWIQLSSQNDNLYICSNHHTAIPQGQSQSRCGPLAAVQSRRHRSGSQAAQLFRSVPDLQQPSTISHLENQLAASKALNSGSEYRFWLLTYIRYLTQEGIETKLRNICDDYLGPVCRSKTTWQSTILGMNKRELLGEFLPIIATNLQLQRLYSEYTEQLENL